MTAPRKTAAKAAPKPAPQVEAEATEEAVKEGSPVVITVGEYTTEVPSDLDYWPADAVIQWSDREHFKAVRTLLGPERWTDWAPLRKDVVLFAGEIAKVLGFGSPGNSQGSSD